MSRALLAVACLLCLSLPAAAVAGPVASGGATPAASEPTQLSNGSTPMLSVAPPAATGSGTAVFDPGVAFAVDGEELRATFDRHRYAAAVENASTDAERRQALSDALDDVRERVDALRERERAATRAYADGNRSDAELRRDLGRIHAEAGGVQSAVESLLGVIQELDAAEALSQRANTLARSTEALRGPLRATLATGVHSTDSTERVYAAATQEGVVLAGLETESGTTTYVRETVRFDNRDGDERSTTFSSASSLYEFMAERYPEATSGPPSLSIQFPGSIHRFDVRHSGGTLTAFVDGSARSVFRDVHSVPVTSLPAGGNESVIGDGLVLRVNRTFTGGPAEVTVRDEVGDPVDASVSVGGDGVGATGYDGVAWIVEPHGEYTVTATRDGDSVSLSLD